MSLPPEATIEDVKVRIRKSMRNPHIGKVEQAVLREGPRAFRLATLFEILNPGDSSHHHYTLRLDSIDKKKTGWFHKPEKSITLEANEPDEISRLYRFLTAHLAGTLSEASGDVRIISSAEYKKLENLLELLPNLASPDMVEVLRRILPRISDAGSYAKDFSEALESSDPDTVEHLGVAARWVQHKREYERLVTLIDSGESREQAYQELLTQNPWMFGSEYSELLDRRTWTRDDSLDFMLRRTSDNYLEIIEIKTPFRDRLMLKDKSHGTYYPSSKLSPTIGQVIGYMEEIERSRDTIISKDGYDTLKVRARVIVGRDGDPSEQEALRNLNAHLHRIEVLTFDHLRRIAERVVNVFGVKESIISHQSEVDEDIPF